MDELTFNQASSIKDSIAVTKAHKAELDEAVQRMDRIESVKLNFLNDIIQIDDPDEELVDMIRDWCDKRVKRLNEQFAAL